MYIPEAAVRLNKLALFHILDACWIQGLQLHTQSTKFPPESLGHNTLCSTWLILTQGRARFFVSAHVLDKDNE